MGYLIDTNVLSELRKRDRCSPNVMGWYTATAPSELFLSVLVVGEIRRGIDSLARRDAQTAGALEGWLARVIGSYGDRMLPVTADIAERWGRLNVPNPMPVVDGLLAATAQIHGHILVTRNTRDLAGTGTALPDPFAELARPVR